MNGMTERAAEIVRLRDREGLSWAAIAERLGTTKGSVNSSYRNVKAKQDRQLKPRGNAVEVKKPEETPVVLDMATEPFATIAAATKACGFPESTLKQLLKRMRTRYRPLDDAVRRVKREDMIQLLEDRAMRCIEYADDFAMSGASLRAARDGPSAVRQPGTKRHPNSAGRKKPPEGRSPCATGGRFPWPPSPCSGLWLRCFRCLS